MRFQDIPGMDDVKLKLTSSVNNNTLAHAQLLAGKPGAWNLPLALAFSAYIHCENRNDHDACGQCGSCSQHEKFIHPDVSYVFPLTSQKGVKSDDVISRNYLKNFRSFLSENPYRDIEDWAAYIEGENKSFNISKEESRQIIQNLSLKSFTGGFKIVIIWLPEYMHINAANGILKVLEEPAEKTLFLLVSQNSDRLLTTILSRTRQIQIRNPKDIEIKDWLKSKMDLSDEKAAQLSLSSDGNISSLLKILEQKDDMVMDFFRKWLLACYRLDQRKMIEYADSFGKMNKVIHRSFFAYGQNVMRDCLLIISKAHSTELISDSYKEFVIKLAALLNISKIELFSQQLGETAYYLERNANSKLAFLNMSVKMAHLFRK